MNNPSVQPGLDFLLFSPETVALLFVKLLLWAGFFIYLVFSFLLIRQTTLMEATFKTALGPVLKIFAIAHFLVAVGIFTFAIVTL